MLERKLTQAELPRMSKRQNDSARKSIRLADAVEDIASDLELGEQSATLVSQCLQHTRVGTVVSPAQKRRVRQLAHIAIRRLKRAQKLLHQVIQQASEKLPASAQQETEGLAQFCAAAMRDTESMLQQLSHVREQLLHVR
ncbi:MAG: hypothetical protein MHM6MM_000240 [Cercozoa sp. M6MM]